MKTPNRPPIIETDTATAFSRLIVEVAHYQATRKGKIFLDRAAVQYAQLIQQGRAA